MKLLRPIVKCQKCGYRKRVNLRYRSSKVVWNSVFIKEPVISPERVEWHCAICDCWVGNSATIDQIHKAKEEGRDITAKAK